MFTMNDKKKNGILKSNLNLNFKNDFIFLILRMLF